MQAVGRQRDLGHRVRSRSDETGPPTAPRVLPLRGVVLSGAFTDRPPPHTLQPTDRDRTVRAVAGVTDKMPESGASSTGGAETDAVIEAIGRSRLFRGVAEADLA